MKCSSKPYIALPRPYDVHSELIAYANPMPLNAIPIDQIAREIHGMGITVNGCNVFHIYRQINPSNLPSFDPDNVESAEACFAVDDDSMSDETWNWTVRQWCGFLYNGPYTPDPALNIRFRLPTLPILDRDTLRGFRARP